jgi:restriction endonuclease Mrr
MKLPKPQYIANQLVETGSNLEYNKLKDVLYQLLKSKYSNCSDEEAWDYLEQFNSDIAKELFRKENDSHLDGVQLNFDIAEEDDGYYVKFYDKPEIQLLREVQRDSSSNFEIFCKDLLHALGGRSSVSGGINDGGIDFYAFDLQINKLPNYSTKGSKIVVIGQAKRYKDGNHVKEKELREFIGASVKKIDELKKSRSETIGIFQPIILAFWTTSDFTEGAKKYANELGIWYLNGIALCQIAMKVGINKSSHL